MYNRGTEYIYVLNLPGAWIMGINRHKESLPWGVMHAYQSFSAHFPRIGYRCPFFFGVVVLSRLSAFDLANIPEVVLDLILRSEISDLIFKIGR